MGKKDDKTNVMRLLDQKKVSYTPYNYTQLGLTNGAEIAKALKEDPKRVFKTLVTVAKSRQNYVFVIPVEEELDLKAAAKAVGEKSIAMIPQKELLPLTGYVHGGCSPIGMKKVFPTVIYESAKEYETILFSGGKVGYQVEVSPSDLEKIIRVEYGDIIVHS
ncbi:MAG: Cys-tRNA(Pro) deacylase [Lachnospiraceae bacterium]|nr:Cys-tRNA(Pro) deacylase [Lachnospiraceae bacterium]MBQ2576427.1 Cys-tRNA(Pro) deacylase [Lachnospiraceae bacterium]MCR4732048.1 Cys-tRNA(Pro) deacylase [Lachnospiraceae bacterium]MEE3356085.1 Cys-tRNA(Pro) deacylase [Candidatus Weimeria sp.]